MTVEIDDIAAFLRAIVPFDTLEKAALERLAGGISVRYAKRGDRILSVGEENHHLFIVRTGAVELKEHSDSLTARLGEGRCFAYPSLLRGGEVRNGVTAIEDTLLYLIPADTFRDLRQIYPAVSHFFAGAEAERLRAAIAAIDASGQLGGQQTLASLLRRPVVSCQSDATVAQAAALMTREAVSSLLVMREERLAGIITDKDMRARAVAQSLPPETPVEDIMTPDPVTVQAARTVLDAMIMMADRGIHHLPVVGDDGVPLGLVTSNDLLAAQAAGAVPLTKAVRKSAGALEMRAALSRLPQMAVNLLEGGVEGATVAAQIAGVGMAAHRRIIALAEADLGPPPVPYCFLVFGSLARRDQTLSTDQDNGFLLSDDYDPKAHGAYFESLAERVCGDLDAAGYPFCGGGIMASNPKWRLPLAGWKQRFEDWIRAPEPKALMHATIFFDNTAAYGDAGLRDALMAHMLPIAAKNQLFLAHMVENALFANVPIGFFRRFVLTHDRDHVERLDIKKNGLVPLVDIVRVYALAHGIEAPGVMERVSALKGKPGLADADLDEMLDAWRFLMTVRMAHQARQISRSEAPDNMVAPSSLSAFEQAHLRDAFKLTKTHQGGLSRALAGGVY